MPQRRFGNDNRYGFNGKERDKDMHSLTAYDYGFRIYNPAIGKFLSVDPLTQSYPELTPYQFASNTPIWAIDLDGLEAKLSNFINFNNSFLAPITPHDIKKAGDFAVNEILPRIGGVLKVAAGVAIMAFGAVATPEAPTVGIPTMAYGADVGGAGLRQIWYGSPQKTITRQVLEDHGMSEEEAGFLDDVATGTLAMSPFSRATTPVYQQTRRGIIVESESSSASSVTATKELQIGAYSAMKKVNAKTGMSADHIPSFAAIKTARETALGRKLLESEATTLRNETLTMVYDTKIHHAVSRTFAGRNNPVQIAMDAVNLPAAIVKDIQALTPSLLKEGYTQSQINTAQQQLTKKYSVSFK